MASNPAVEDHSTPILAASSNVGQTNVVLPQLLDDDEEVDAVEQTGRTIVDVDVDVDVDVENAGDSQRSRMNTTREASMLVGLNNGEPPPLDKATLLGLIAVYFSVFLDMMGISIVQPVLPFYAEKFGANSFELGALYSSYSLMATFASYAMGKASDKYGRRPSILFSLFGTMLGFTVTGLAQDYGSLLAFRFLTGSFGGSAPIAQAYITDVVPSTQRAKYLAFTGATAALSFIIGPGIGSGLSEFGIRIPFFVAGGLGGAGLLFAYFVLGESHPVIKHGSDDKHKKNDDDDDDTAADDSAADGSTSTTKKEEYSDSLAKEVYIIGVLGIFNNIGWTSYTAMFAYYIIEKYGINPIAVGYITLSLATVYVFTNIVIFSQISKRLGVYMCAFIGSLIFSLGMGILPLFDNIWLTIGCMGLGAAIGNGLVLPAMSAMAADYSNPSNRGKVLAFSNAASNLGMVVGPLFYGLVYEINPDFVYFSAAGFIFISWLCILYLVGSHPELRKPAKLRMAMMMKQKEKEKKLEQEQGTQEEKEKEWKWVPDVPAERDYRRLGTFLGKLLTQRHYNWVTHYEPMTQYLKDIFPVTRISSLHDHYQDIQYLQANVSNMRTEYDAVHAEFNMTYA